jgi:hypothetical protein
MENNLLHTEIKFLLKSYNKAILEPMILFLDLIQKSLKNFIGFETNLCNKKVMKFIN